MDYFSGFMVHAMHFLVSVYELRFRYSKKAVWGLGFSFWCYDFLKLWMGLFSTKEANELRSSSGFLFSGLKCFTSLSSEFTSLLKSSALN